MVNRLWRRVSEAFKSDKSNSFLEDGISYLDNGEYGKALFCFEELIRLDPADREAYRLRGNVFIAVGDYDRAIENYDKAIELGANALEMNRGDAEAYSSRGVAYHHKGAYVSAISDYTKSIDLFQTHIVFDMPQEDSLEFESDEARQRSRNLRSHFSYRIAVAYSSRGNSYKTIGDLDKAVEDYSMAIELNPESSVNYSNRGGAFIHKAVYSSAMEDLNRAVVLDPENVEAYIARGHIFTETREYAKAADDFRKANELNSDYVTNYFSTAYHRGVDDSVRSYAPHDIINTIRQHKILNSVSEAVISRRAQQGFPKAITDSVLGNAALRITAKFAEVEIDGPEQVHSEFNQFIRQGEGEYQGWTGIEYYRETWPMDTPDDEIISTMTEVLCRQVSDFAYEDEGFGASCGYTDDSYSRVGVFIAIGYGCTDGSAHAVMRINQAREEAKVPRLTIDHSLRAMARKYRPMATTPDDSTLRQDLIQYRYINPGFRARYFFNGSHSPFLKDVLQDTVGLLSYERLGDLAAAALLKDYEDILLRSDWQDIAVTTSLSSPSESEGPRVQSEFVIGWRMPEGT